VKLKRHRQKLEIVGELSRWEEGVMERSGRKASYRWSEGGG
jgi:hypothetical protein